MPPASISWAEAMVAQVGRCQAFFVGALDMGFSLELTGF